MCLSTWITRWWHEYVNKEEKHCTIFITSSNFLRYAILSWDLTNSQDLRNWMYNMLKYPFINIKRLYIYICIYIKHGHSFRIKRLLVLNVKWELYYLISIIRLNCEMLFLFFFNYQLNFCSSTSKKILSTFNYFCFCT